MSAGVVINGYTLVTNFTTVGGGLSRWAFARRDGQEYFLKEFLAPTYPVDGAPGSPATRQKKRQQCEEFEAQHRALKRAVDSASAAGGNLIKTIDFFRVGARYYKVTEKVDVSGLGVADIAALPIERRILIMKTVAHSLSVLHNLKIVHGDLKPGNVLIKRSKTGDFVAKLIDFDNSYFDGKPATVREEIVGDVTYYSPELARYIVGDSHTMATDLRVASDIFALGLIFAQYLTGELPVFDPKYRYACDAVNDGVTISGRSSSAALSALIEEMLRKDFTSRPTIKQVFERLKAWKPDPPPSLLRGVPPPRPAPPAPPAPSAGESKLRGTLLKKKP